MSASRLLLGAAVVSFAFAFSAHSQAYCLTYTCDANKENCPTDSVTGCNVGGKPLFWASPLVSFSIQKDGSKRQNISAEQLNTVVTNAFQRWVNATCSDGNGPSISLIPFGPVECAKPEYNKTQPNQNVITFHDAEWPYKNTGAETLALTTVFFNPETGEIYDANIEINSYQPDDGPPRFVIGAVNADSSHDDLNAVLTHELGHFLGLSHSSVTQATMYQSYDLGMTTLEADDMAAICESLPPNRTPGPIGDPPGVPRHGFSSECGKPENGCCASTIGGSAPSSGPLALWAFGLGLVAWCGRSKRWARGKRSRALPR